MVYIDSPKNPAQPLRLLAVGPEPDRHRGGTYARGISNRRPSKPRPPVFVLKTRTCESNAPFGVAIGPACEHRRPGTLLGLHEGRLLEVAPYYWHRVESQPLLHHGPINSTEVRVVVQVPFQQVFHLQRRVVTVHPSLHRVSDGNEEPCQKRGSSQPISLPKQVHAEQLNHPKRCLYPPYQLDILE